MTIIQFTTIIIYIHVVFGTLALLAGLAAMIAKKGSKIHKKTGQVFFYALLISGILSLIITQIPEHENPFLFAIGIFTIYLILSGYLALRYKQKSVNLVVDKILSGTMLFIGLSMIFYPVIQYGTLNSLFSIFGLLGVALSVLDFIRYRNKTVLRQKYLQIHLAKMIGGFIASVTAFIIANDVLSNLIGWLSPTLIGGFFIAYWVRKLRVSAKKG